MKSLNCYVPICIFLPSYIPYTNFRCQIDIWNLPSHGIYLFYSNVNRLIFIITTWVHCDFHNIFLIKTAYLYYIQPIFGRQGINSDEIGNETKEDMCFDDPFPETPEERYTTLNSIMGKENSHLCEYYNSYIVNIIFTISHFSLK